PPRLVGGAYTSALRGAAAGGVSVSPDGKAPAGGGGGAIPLWGLGRDEAQHKEVLQHTDSIIALAFRPYQGRPILVSAAATEATVRVWDLSVRPARVQPARGHQGPVFCLAFSADARALASGGYDKTVWLWRLEDSAFRERV